MKDLEDFDKASKIGGDERKNLERVNGGNSQHISSNLRSSIVRDIGI